MWGLDNRSNCRYTNNDQRNNSTQSQLKIGTSEDNKHDLYSYFQRNPFKHVQENNQIHLSRIRYI